MPRKLEFVKHALRAYRPDVADVRQLITARNSSYNLGMLATARIEYAHLRLACTTPALSLRNRNCRVDAVELNEPWLAA